jgi:hypothetical protein
MSALTRETLDRAWASRKFGTAMAARIAMIATTIRSSINVNPSVLELFFIFLILCDVLFILINFPKGKLKGNYNSLTQHNYLHGRTVLSDSGDPAHVAMPGVHRIAALLKRWLLGIHQGGVSGKHLDYYLSGSDGIRLITYSSKKSLSSTGSVPFNNRSKGPRWN